MYNLEIISEFLPSFDYTRKAIFTPEIKFPKIESFYHPLFKEEGDLALDEFSRVSMPPIPRTATELEKALAKGDLEKVKELVEKGADVNAFTNYGIPIVSLVFMNKNTQTQTQIVSYLIENGLDYQNISGSLLINAIFMKNNSLIDLLLFQKDLDLEKKDHKGRTALVYAVCYNQTDLVRKLVYKCKANVNAQDSLGLSVLDYAKINNSDYEIKEMLITRGAQNSLYPLLKSRIIEIKSTKDTKSSQNIDGEQNALVIFTNQDHNGAFSSEKRVHNLAILALKYRVYYSSISSIEDLNSLLKQRKFSCVALFVHGNTDHINLAKNFSIRLDEISKIAIEALADKTLFILNACRSAFFANALFARANQLNLHLKILAMKIGTSDLGTNLYYNKKGKLKIEFESFHRNDTYKIKNY